MLLLSSFFPLSLILAASAAAPPGPSLRARRSGGCGKAPPFAPGQFNDYTTASGREYRVWLPAGYDESEPTPLILSYHGANRVISHQVALDRLSDPLFNDDHIVVYLQGTADDPSRPDHTTWEGAPDSTSDDVGFTREALDAVSAALCVDERRVFATGKSQGGGFVGRLACDAALSARVAAFAPVAGAYYIREIDTEAACLPASVTVPCAAARTDVPVLAFHGGADTTIRYAGGFRSGACLPSVRSWARQWARRDGLTGAPHNTSIPGSVHGVAMRYGEGADLGLVTLVYAGDDIGHDWPATVENSDNGGERIAAFNASAWIMDFFRGHALP
ncbi:carbohydrate esterase family 1 protein [Durotheca rogersii]|uniref:carbohydrate esterase family 1 protein n=1 Tax=Durotheca rogersii TaxID=419775 RepID=UPI00221F7CFA|nr:carbohydrate esterase family 1 protein [Durotheca rogersii]KAI5861525.1 carbohydrate esterase family 1 protein [Durotheca rogersii]